MMDMDNVSWSDNYNALNEKGYTILPDLLSKASQSCRLWVEKSFAAAANATNVKNTSN